MPAVFAVFFGQHATSQICSNYTEVLLTSAGAHSAQASSASLACGLGLWRPLGPAGAGHSLLARLREAGLFAPEAIVRHIYVGRMLQHNRAET